MAQKSSKLFQDALARILLRGKKGKKDQASLNLLALEARLNPAPNLMVPVTTSLAPLGFVAGTTLPFSGALEIDLLDTPSPASQGTFSVTITATAGTANIDPSGLSSLVVSNNNTANVRLSGSLADINTALATLTYSNPTPSGTAATLNLTAEDSSPTPLTSSRDVFIRAMDSAVAPTINSALGNVTYFMETAATPSNRGVITVAVSDPQGTAGLTVTATSDNQNLVPAANITLGGTTPNFTVTLRTASQVTGTANITVKVSDAQGNFTTKTFQVTVNPVPNIYWSTLAGSPTGASGSTDGTGTAALLAAPHQMALDRLGNLILADFSNHRIRKITPAGVVTTIAGTGAAGTGNGTVANATFYSPVGVAVDAGNNIYVGDYNGHTIRKIEWNAGTSSYTNVTTVSGSTAGFQDGAAGSAKFNQPLYLAISPDSTKLYVADGANHRIRQIDLANSNAVSTLAGSGTNTSVDGTGTAATFNRPYSMEMAANGDILVVEEFGAKARRVTPAGVVTTLAKVTPLNGYSDLIQLPGGDYLFADGSSSLRRANAFDSAPAAGSGTANTNDGINTGAGFNSTRGFVQGALGTLYISNNGYNNVRRGVPYPTLYNPGTQAVTEGTSLVFSNPDSQRLGAFSTAVDANGNPLAVTYTAVVANGTLSFGAANVPQTLTVTGSGGRTVTVSGPQDTVNAFLANLTYTPDAGYINTRGDGTALASGAVNPEALSFTATTANGTVSGSLNIQVRAADNLPRILTAIQDQTYYTESVDGTEAAIPFVIADANDAIANSTSGTVIGNNPTSILYATSDNQNLVTNADLLTAIAGSGANRTITIRHKAGVTGRATITLTMVDATGNTTSRVFRVYAIPAPNLNWTTLAGATDGSWGSTDGTGGAARFASVHQIALDTLGNIIAADFDGQRIRKITPAGVATTIAGTGTASSTDGTVANATFNYPTGVAVDANNNIFVAEHNGHRIRKITWDATTSQYTTVSTVAGGGGAGFADGASGTARFNYPRYLALSPDGTKLYVTDAGNHRVRQIDLTNSNAVSTLAGSGAASSLDGTGTAATLNDPFDISLATNGDLLVSESNGARIRRITPAGVVTTLTGLSPVNGIGGIIQLANGDFLHASAANTIKRTSLTDTATAGGNGTNGTADGINSAATFHMLRGFVAAANGTVYVSNRGYSNIRQGKPLPALLTPGLQATTEGNALVFSNANLQKLGIVNSGLDSAGNLFAVTYRLTAQNGTLGLGGATIPQGLTVTGAGGRALTLTGSEADINGVLASLTYTPDAGYVNARTDGGALAVGPGYETLGISASTPNGTVTGSILIAVKVTDNSPRLLASLEGVTQLPDQTYFADSAIATETALPFILADGDSATFANSTASTNIGSNPTSIIYATSDNQALVRDVDLLTAIAGSGKDRTITIKHQANITGVANITVKAVDANGNFATRVLRVNVIPSPQYYWDVLAGSSSQASGYVDSTSGAARFSGPVGMVIDSQGNLFVSDFYNHRIRRVTPAGVVTTFAGSGATGSADGTGTGAQFNSPLNLAIDADDNLFVADWANNRIRKITPAGVVTTVAGSGTQGGSDNANPLLATFNRPEGMTIGLDRSLYVTDLFGHVVRKIAYNSQTGNYGAVTTLAGSYGQTGSADGVGTAARFDQPCAITYLPGGKLVVRDFTTGKLRQIDIATGAVTTIGQTGVNNSKSGLATDRAGNLYVPYEANSLYLQTAADAVRILGNGTAGNAAGINSAATVNDSRGVAFAPDGTVYMATAGGNNIRVGIPYPSLYNPGSKTVAQGGTLPFSGLATARLGALANARDAGGATLPITYTLRAGFGTFSFGSAQAPQGLTVSGSGTRSVTLTGSETDLNAYLLNLAYTPLPGYMNAKSDGSALASGAVNPDQISFTATTAKGSLSGSLDVVVRANGTAPFNFTSFSDRHFFAESAAVTETAIPFTIGDSDTATFTNNAATGARISATSDNPNLFLPSDMATAVGGSGANRTLTLRHQGGVTGSANIKLTISDGTTTASFTFKVTVSPVLNYNWEIAAWGTAAGTRPHFMVEDPDGNIIIAGYDSNNIIRLTPAGVSTVIAGTGTAGGTDNANPLQATFAQPIGIAIDGSRNLYVSESAGHRIRKIAWDAANNRYGAVTTYAGTGSAGADDGPRQQATFTNPVGLTMGLDGTSLYLAGGPGNNIRRIDTLTGVVSTLAGSGAAGTQDGFYKSASFNGPYAINLAPNGDLIIHESGSSLIRQVTTAGMVSTLSPGLPSGRGLGSIIRLNNGYLVTSSSANQLQVMSETDVSAFAGSGAAGSAVGLNLNATFNDFRGLLLARNGTIYASDFASSIRAGVPMPSLWTPGAQLTTEGTPLRFNNADLSRLGVMANAYDPTTGSALPVSYTLTVANGTMAFGGVAAPQGLTVTGLGTGSLSLSGSEDLVNSHLANLVYTPNPNYVNAKPDGSAIATGPNAFETMNISATTSRGTSTGTVTLKVAPGNDSPLVLNTWNGTTYLPAQTYYAEGIQATETALPFVIADLSDTSFSNSNASTVVGPNLRSTVYAVSDNQSLVRDSDLLTAIGGSGKDRTISVVHQPGVTGVANITVWVVDAAGNTGSKTFQVSVVPIPNYWWDNIAGSLDGTAGNRTGLRSGALVNGVHQIALDNFGNLILADYQNCQIKYISAADGITRNLAGTGAASSTDGAALSTATFNYPTGVAVDAANNIYVADYSGNRIRKIAWDSTTSTWTTVSTIAGSGAAGGTNGTGTAATFTNPIYILVSQDTNELFVAEHNGHRIRKVNLATNAVTTLAGSGGNATVDGTGTAASFSNPYSIAWDLNGDILVGSGGGYRRVTRAGVVTTLTELGAQTFGYAPLMRLRNGSYVADVNSTTLRLVSPFDTIRLVGNSSGGQTVGLNTAARLNDYRAALEAPDGTIYLSGGWSNNIRAGRPYPSLYNPGFQTVTEGGSLTFSNADKQKVGVVSNGRDSQGNSLPVTLKATATFGTLTFNGVSVPQGLTVSGTGGRTVTVGGTEAAVNAFMANLTYIPDSGYANATATGAAFPGGAVPPATLRLEASNSFGTVSGSLDIVVRAANAGTPHINTLSDREYFVETGIATETSVEVQIGDGDTSSFANGGTSGARIYATSDNQNLVLNGDLVFTGSTGTRSLAMKHQANVTGTANITVTLTDGTTTVTRSFKVTVVPRPNFFWSLLAGSPTGTAGLKDAKGSGALINDPGALAMDSQGNIFVAEWGNNVIRKVTPDGVVSVFAGSASGAFGFQDGTGTAARFNRPISLAIDGLNNLYVTDCDNHRIRKITPGGVVTTIAGSGTLGFVNGLAGNSQFNYPAAIAVSADGSTVYVADTNNHAIRIIRDGQVWTLAGGTAGNADGAVGSAQFNRPRSVLLKPDGNLLLRDASSGNIREVTPGGVVTTIATTPVSYSTSDYQFVAVDPQGNRYQPDGNGALNLVGANDTIRFVGNGTVGLSYGLNTDARIEDSRALVFGPDGSFYLSGTGSTNNVRKGTPLPSLWLPGGQTTAQGVALAFSNADRQKLGVVGAGKDSQGNALPITYKLSATYGTLSFGGAQAPQGLTVTGTGSRSVTLVGSDILINTYLSNLVYIPDSDYVNAAPGGGAPATGAVPAETLAVTASTSMGSITGSVAVTVTATDNRPWVNQLPDQTYYADAGVATEAGISIQLPDGDTAQANFINNANTGARVTATSDNPNIFLPADMATAITGTGAVRTLTLKHQPGVTGVANVTVTIHDGTTSFARTFRVTVNAAPAYYWDLLAGSPSASSGSTDGVGTAAKFAMAAQANTVRDSQGNLFVAEYSNHVVRKITPLGQVSVFAGLAGTSGATDGTGGAARFFRPTGLAIDAQDNLYVTDTDNHRIRKITPTGVVTTIAGNGTSGNVDGRGTATSFYWPTGLVVAPSGDIYVANQGSHAIRKMSLRNGDYDVTTIAGYPGTSGDVDGYATTARFNRPWSIQWHPDGYLVIRDDGTGKVRKVTPDGWVSTIGTSAASTELSVSIDPRGNVYIPTTLNTWTLAGATDSTVVMGDGTGGTAIGINTAARLLGARGAAWAPDGTAYLLTKGDQVRAGRPLPSLRNPGTQTTNANTAVTFANAATQGFGVSVNGMDAQGNLLPVTYRATATYGLLSFNNVAAPQGLTVSGAGTREVTLTGTEAAINAYLANLTYTPDQDYVNATASGGDFASGALPADQIILTASSSMGSNTTSVPVRVRSTNNEPRVNPVADRTYYVESGATSESAISIQIADADTAAFANGGTTGARITASSDNQNVLTDASLAITGTGGTRTLAITHPANITGTATVTLTITDGASSYVRTFRVTVVPRPNYAWSVWAGSPSGAAGSTNGNGTAALFSDPNDIVRDSQGNIYAAEFNNHVIRKIAPNGDVTVFAGGLGLAGYTDATGTAARFNGPVGLAIDSQGNLYVGEEGNKRIRMITPLGVVTTFAGNGVDGGLDGSLLQANLGSPNSIVIAPGGVMYVASQYRHTLRKIENGAVTTIAGLDGTAGSVDGIGGDARLNGPCSLKLLPNGNLLMREGLNGLIREVTPQGKVTTVGSSPSNKWSDVFVDPQGNRYMTATGDINSLYLSSTFDSTAIIGNGTAGYASGVNTAAQVSDPRGMVFTTEGVLYLASAPQNNIRRGLPLPGLYNPGEQVANQDQPFVFSNADRAGLGALANGRDSQGVALPVTYTLSVKQGVLSFNNLQTPQGLTITGIGTRTVRITGSENLINSHISNLTYTGDLGYANVDQNGQPLATGSPDPEVLSMRATTSVGTVTGSLNIRVKAANAAPAISTSLTVDGVVAGQADLTERLPFTFTDADTLPATFVNNATSGARIRVTTDKPALFTNLSVTGTGYQRHVEFTHPARVTGTGNITITVSDGALSVSRTFAVTVRPGISNVYMDVLAGDTAGVLGASGATDGTGNAARLDNPAGLVADSAGNLYFLDSSGGGATIRKVTPAGAVSTLSGSASARGYVDGAAASARFGWGGANQVTDQQIAIDSSGNLYVLDEANNSVRKVTPQGDASTVFTLPAATFNGQMNLAISPDGFYLYIGDRASAGLITRLDLQTLLADTLAGTGGFGGGIAIRADGSLLIDNGTNRVITNADGTNARVLINGTPTSASDPAFFGPNGTVFGLASGSTYQPVLFGPAGASILNMGTTVASGAVRGFASVTSGQAVALGSVTGGTFSNGRFYLADKNRNVIVAGTPVPAFHNPGVQTISESIPLVFSSLNRVAVETFADSTTVVTLTISASKGSLTLARTTGLTFTTGTGANEATMTFTGTQAAINSALDGLVYDFDQSQFSAPTTDDLSLLVSRTTVAGTGGSQTFTYADTVPLRVGIVPTMTPIRFIGMLPAWTPPTRSFTVTDMDSSARQFTFEIASSNQALLPDSAITLTPGTGATGTTAPANARYTLSFAPVANVLGTSNVTIRVTDEGGFSSTRSFEFIVANCVISDYDQDTGVSDADGITRDKTIFLRGGATYSNGATVEIFDGSTSLGTVNVLSDSTWVFTTTALREGSHSITGVLAIPGSNTRVTSNRLDLMVDNTAPSVTFRAITGDDLISYSEKNGTVTLEGVTEAGASVVISWLDTTGQAVSAPAVVTDTGSTATWRYTLTAQNWTSIGSATSKQFTATSTDAAGNSSTATRTATIVQNPLSIPGVPDLPADFDTGSSDSDNRTSVRTVPLDVSLTTAGAGAATAGMILSLVDGQGNILSSRTLTAADISAQVYRFNYGRLDDGTYEIGARLLDPATQETSVSPGNLTLVIDNRVPGATGVPDLTAAKDSGFSSTDNITSNLRPTWLVDISGQAGLDSNNNPVPLVAGDMVFVFNQSDISGGVPVNGATPLVVGTVGSGDVAAGSISLTVGSDLAEGVYRLVSIGRSAAGVYGKPSAVAGLTIDTTAPLASSRMSLESASDTGIAGDGITNVEKPVMVVDLAGTGIQAGDRVELLGAANAVIGTALATAADITAGTIAVGVTTVLSEGQHAIRSRITDLAGNVGAVSPAFTLTVDLTPPSAPGNLGLDASSDTGDPGDGITQDSTPTISGTGGTPGEIISLYDGNGTSPVGVAVVGGDGKWSVTPAAPLSGGAHSLTVTTTDMGGNESGRSQPLSVTVDTAKPTLVTAETTLDGTRVVLTFNETLSATTAAVSGFAVQSGTGSTLSPNAVTAVLISGNQVILTLTTSIANGQSVTVAYTDPTAQDDASALQDLAGNDAESIPATAVTNLVPDTTAPTLVSAATNPAGTKLILTYNEALGATTAASTDFSYTVNGGTAQNPTLVVIVGNTVELTLPAVIANGETIAVSYTDPTAGNDANAVQDVSGNDAPSFTSVTVNNNVPDTTPPAAPATPSSVTQDTGVAGDQITGDNTLTVTGTAEPGSTVKVYDGSTVVGTAVANSSGNYTVTTSVLADGSHALSLTATDGSGNQSSATSIGTWVIDTSSPAAPPAPASVGDDTGVAGDKITRDKTLTITGTAEPNSTVTVYANGVAVGSAVANGSGSYSVTTSALAEGNAYLTITARDTAGNEGAATSVGTWIIDSVAPPIPPAPASIGTDTGVAGDRITSANTLTVTGTAEPGSTVKVYDGTTVVGTAVADSSGNYTVTTSVLADGNHALSLKATDTAGNEGAARDLDLGYRHRAAGGPGHAVLHRDRHRGGG